MSTSDHEQALADLRSWLGASGRRVAVVSALPDRITLRLDLDSGGVEVMLEAPAPGRNYFLAGRHLASWYSGDIGPEALEAVKALHARIADVPFPTLLEHCLPAAPPQAPQAPESASADARRVDPAMRMARLTSFFKRPNRAEDWARFIVPERPFLASSVQLPQGSVELQHGTLECLFNDVKSAQVPSLWLFADTRLFNSYDGRFPRYHTDLGEAEILGGSTAEHLRRAMRELSETHRPTFLHLATTCLPELIGEDPSDAITDQRCRCDVLWTAKTRSSRDSIATWFGAQVQAIPPTAPAPDAVAVAGVRTEAERTEVEQLLAMLGLRAVGQVLPNLDLAKAPRIAEARAVVFGNGTGWGAFGDAVFAPRFRVVRPAPPMGEAATLAWVEAVGTTLDVPGTDAAIHALRAEFRNRLEPIRRDASTVTVALIGSPQALDLLVRPGFYGFSVARCLGDLGFRVHCLVQPDADAPMNARPVLPLGAGTIAFSPFSTPDELDALLADADVAFSHFTVHPYLAARGIRAFCQDVFGLGVSGLVDAARAILSRARRRWAPAWRRHLGSGGAP